MKITYLIEGTSEDNFESLSEKAVVRRKRSNYDEFILYEGNFIRVEKDDTTESLFEKYLKAQAEPIDAEPADEMQPETIQGDVPNPKWKKLREQAAITIGATKLANSKAQTAEEIAQIAKSSVDFATMLVRQLEITE